MSNREPTIEEWFAIFNVARDKAKRSIEGDYDEYQERYMRIMTDADNQIRSWCNRMNSLERDKDRQRRTKAALEKAQD